MGEQFNENMENGFGNEPFNQNTEKKTREKKPMTTGKKWAAVVAMALVFGLVAGGVMVGVNAAGGYLLNRENKADQIGQTQTVNSDSGTASSGR